MTRPTRAAWLLLLLVGALGLGVVSSIPPAYADDEPEAAPPEDEPAPADPPAAKDPEQPEVPDRPDVHKLYVPFRDLRDIFEKEGEGVFLPYAEFKKLWERAYRVPPDTKTPPVAAAVRSAVYRGVVDADMIRLEAELDVEVLADGWQRVPLGFRGIGVETATIDGAPALLVPAKHGYDLLLQDAGRRTLTLTLRAGAPPAGDTHVSEFELPPVPLARLTMRVPGTDTDVQIAPRLASSVRPAADDTTELLAFLGPVSKVKLTWRRKPEDRPTLAPMVFASEQTTARVDRGVVRTELRATLSILRAPLTRLAVTVPEDAVVLYVNGDGIRTWTRSEDGASIAIELRDPVKETYALEVGLEQPFGETPLTVAVPLAALEGMERESGFLRLDAAEGVKIEPEAGAGLIQIDQQDVPEGLQSGAKGRAVYYRHPTRPAGLSVQVEDLEPRVSALLGNRIGVRAEGLELRAVANLTVDRAGIFGVDFDLPEGVEVTNLTLAGVELDDYRQEPAEDGRSRLRVAFRDRLLGNATVRITGRSRVLVPEDEGQELLLDVPLLRILGATHLKGYVAVHVESALDRREVGQKDLTPLDATARAAIEPEGLPGGGAPLPLVYRFEHREGDMALQLGLKRKAPLITAQVLTNVTLEPNLTKVEPLLSYTVTFRGERYFRFRAPLSDDLPGRLKLADTSMELNGPAEEVKPEGAPDDWKPTYGIWTVRLPAPRTGRVDIQLVLEDAEEKTLGSGEQRVTRLPTFVPMQADKTPLPNTVHFVAVRRDALLQVAPEAITEAEEIDARELPASLQDPANFLAFRAYDAGHALSVRVVKHDYEPVAALVLQHVHLDTVLPAEGRATTEAYIVVRNNDRQYLELELPGAAKVRAVRVGDTSVQPRKGKEGTLLIPIMSGRAKDEAFVVALVYDHDVPASDGLYDTYTLDAPRAVGEVKSDILTWRVFAPADRTWTSFGGTLERVDPEHSWAQALLARIGDTFGTRDMSRRIDFRELIHGVKSPFQTKHEGTPIDFQGRMGAGAVELTGIEPGRLSLLKLLWFVVALGAVVVAVRVGRAAGLTPLRVTVAGALALLALLIPAQPGFAAVLNAMLFGVLLAGAGFFVAGVLRRESKAARAAADPATSQGAPADAPAEADAPSDPDAGSDEAKGGDA